jgi:hypothetical protein
MSRQLGHPDPAALALIRAPGQRARLASTRRGRRLSAHAARCPRCAQVCKEIDAVSGALATAATPPLPESLERRILTALSLEAVSRVRQRGPLASPASTRLRRRWRPAHGPQRVLFQAAACLLVIGVAAGYLIQETSTGAGGSPRAKPASQQASEARAVQFLVSDSGIRYRSATLRTQVRDRLAAQASMPAVGPVVTPSPSASPAASVATASPAPAAGDDRSPDVIASTATPSPVLVGCVMHLTGNVPPDFVDRATYQSRPAYVIVVGDEVWVVGINCTATQPRLITSVHLNPGN